MKDISLFVVANSVVAVSSADCSDKDVTTFILKSNVVTSCASVFDGSLER